MFSFRDALGVIAGKPQYPPQQWVTADDEGLHTDEWVEIILKAQKLGVKYEMRQNGFHMQYGDVKKIFSNPPKQVAEAHSFLRSIA